MKSIPIGEFKPLIGTDILIDFKETNLRNFSGSIKLIVIRLFEDVSDKKSHHKLQNMLPPPFGAILL
jgi:hypothetical protein